jgi:hypothetical protein
MIKNSDRQLYKLLHPELLVHFQKQWEDSIIMLAQSPDA